MKLIVTLLFSVIIAVSLQAQPYFNFRNYEEVPCLHDSTFIMKKIVDWEVYQTENDLWDGAHTRKCIPIEENDNGSARIPLAYLNLDKPVFLRYTGDKTPAFQLESNWLYRITALTSLTDNFSIKSGFDCPGGWCSGLMINIRVPDETGTSTNVRTYRNDNIVSEPTYLEICYPTEYFSENNLDEVVMKFTVLPEGDVNEDFITIFECRQEPSWSDILPVTELEIPESYRDDSIYVVDYLREILDDGWRGEPILVYGDMDRYPSADNIFHVEAFPEINRPEPQKIKIYLDSWSFLYMQPFTALRGGLVQDSDSIRHSVELINRDVFFCLNNSAELTIDGENSRYTHASGDIYFGNRNSCMQFRNGAALNIAEDAEFKFGDEGNGLLVFRGGKLELQKNATFILDARMDFAEKGKNQTISVNLERGKKLIFTKKAKLLNRASQKDLKLDIYMNGGELDMENLDANSRRLINLIYPEPKPAFAENVLLFPNPVSDHLNIHFLGKADEKLTIEFLDLTGRVFYKKEEIAVQGWNEFSISDLNFVRGVYFVKMSSGGDQVAERIFVK